MFNAPIMQINPTITAVATLIILLNLFALADLVVIVRRGGVFARTLR